MQEKENSLGLPKIYPQLGTGSTSCSSKPFRVILRGLRGLKTTRVTRRGYFIKTLVYV